MNQLIQSKNATILPVLIALTLGCFGLTPQARAVCQEGCLTNNNTVLGDDALFNTTGSDNTAIGSLALKQNTTGYDNTATGFGALFSNTTGNNNTATGFDALTSNTAGGGNTAVGEFALSNNTTGTNNTATGLVALVGNTTGSNNTATGVQALASNTGDDNTASGTIALFSNTTGNGNTATGISALLLNTTGNANTATGSIALDANTTGDNNTASGYAALFNNTTGSKNIALGFLAGSDLTTGDNNIDIGNLGHAGESGTIRIGSMQVHTGTFIAGIAGATVPRGVAVMVNANGRLGTTTSSARYKEAIQPMDSASEAIHSLKPVTFRYKREIDPDCTPEFGLVAEEVEKVNPDLVTRDEQGKPYTVRYEAVNAMLLNEFLKEHRKGEQQDRKIEELEATVAAQQNGFESQIASLTAALKAQATQIQKVSDQLKTQAPAPRVVANN